MTTRKRLQKELSDITKTPIENITAGPISDSDITKWKATIKGPLDTPYEGGIFHLAIDFSNDYPYKPPKIRFTTKIYHPNITSNTGDICVDILKSAWSPVQSIQWILLSLSSLIANPNPDDPLNSDIARIYKEDRAQYDSNVRKWVAEHATEKS